MFFLPHFLVDQYNIRQKKVARRVHVRQVTFLYLKTATNWKTYSSTRPKILQTFEEAFPTQMTALGILHKNGYKIWSSFGVVELYCNIRAFESAETCAVAPSLVSSDSHVWNHNMWLFFVSDRQILPFPSEQCQRFPYPSEILFSPVFELSFDKCWI